MSGIDSTPMEGFDREAVEDLLQQEGVLDKDAFGVSVMAAFGYRKEDPPREKARQSSEDVVHWA
ncbi:putative NAD(P)H nitroreductase [Lentibacillus sp. JNUCC-1]|nr:putative NAD(P)H nitroreductase [Lentibacillus sp. JNUCC-1]